MKYKFGTDGIRGKANETLDALTAFRIGKYLGYYFSQKEKQTILVGKDTRRSGSMLEHAIASGIAAGGCDAYLLGVGPTPAVAYLVRKDPFVCGVMISASHNPFYDNGIKLFSAGGTKMPREVEERIEAYLEGSTEEIPYATEGAIGEVIDFPNGIEEYLQWLRDTVNLDLTGMRILIDTANGSATRTAHRLLSELGADVEWHHGKPDGLNINTNCGSTHTQDIRSRIVQGTYDIGFAFDGDADRLIAIAPDGQEINGDKILYCCGKYMKQQGILADDVVVTTVMANLGFFRKLDGEGMKYDVTQVGDKYVYESMSKNGYDIGGEQSGHIIFRHHATTGDGLLTALKILEVMVKTGKSINELTDDLFIYPQLLVNVKVKDKEAMMNDPDVLAACQRVKDELGNEGRVLVRPSGTEPLVRVMVEAKSDELCKHYVDMVCEVIQSKC
ncbi:MAG: phosphoglucosamine mutase [Erysipelotrichaceae bacterium]|nr:phosphoglucosamine mutase [Erysipelotrichaceae bacterium]